MTREQFLAHYQEMAGNGLLEFLNKKASDILNSGAIDIEDYQDDYRLPKLVLCAALKDARWQYEPFNDVDKKTVKNLERF